MSLASRHELVLCPQYRLLVLRDIDADAAEGRDQATERATADIAAATSYEVVIMVTQELIPVRLEVEVWDATPRDPDEPDWRGPITSTIESTTGQLLAGDTFGNVIDGIDPPAGPGHCHVNVYHRGRDHALHKRKEFLAALDTDDTTAYTLRDNARGVEQYLLQVWRQK